MVLLLGYLLLCLMKEKNFENYLEEKYGEYKKLTKKKSDE